MNTLIGIAQVFMKTNQLLLLFPAIKRFLFRTPYISNIMTRTQVYPPNRSFKSSEYKLLVQTYLGSNDICKG